jgi:Putative adhesin
MHALLLLVLTAAPTPNTWDFRTSETPKVSVSNINGTVRVQATDGDHVQVEARQEGSEAERRRWRVEAFLEGDDVEVKVCCGPCEEQRRRCDADSLETHLTLKVPRRASLDISAVNADIQVKGVGGRQEVSTVNGKVDVTGSADRLEVSTVNGSVALSPSALADTEVSTVSGNVRLQLPARPDARLDFSSVGGSFNGRGVSLGSVSETWGKGTHDVDVSTVSGSLEVETPRG